MLDFITIMSWHTWFVWPFIFVFSFAHGIKGVIKDGDVFNWEYVSDDVRTGIMNGRTLTDCAIAFCEAVEAKGYDAMVYFNQDQAKNMYRLEELTDYDFWLAMYSDQMDFPYRVEMWQYTEEGSVPGIEGNTDINLYLP